jgi:hypothetical protein
LANVIEELIPTAFHNTGRVFRLATAFDELRLAI